MSRKHTTIIQEPLFVTDYKDIYHQIRNFLAGQMIGATRDEVLLEEVIKCLFCNIYLRDNQIEVESNNSVDLAKQYRRTFTKMKEEFPNIFGNDEELLLDPASITYVHSQLSKIEPEVMHTDPFGDAYEAFIGNSIRGQEGQFFTPQNAVNFLVTMVDPQPGERIIDPACGAGGFLNAAARHLKTKGVSTDQLASTIFGVDKDRYLADLAAARVSLVTLLPAQVYCADSIAWDAEEGMEFPLQHQLGTFDVVLTNPPFGAQIVSAIPELQRTFELGHKWTQENKSGRYRKMGELKTSVPPQVLFIERCLSLVRPGGRLGMVVPESLLSSKNYRYVVQYILDYANLKSVVGMPEDLFKTSGKGGTHTKTCLVLFEKKTDTKTANQKIFMAEAKWCGRDSRGKYIERDELPDILKNYQESLHHKISGHNHLGYTIDSGDVADNVLAPRYYNPDVGVELDILKKTHDLISVGHLVSKGILQITNGDEVGKMAYSTGDVPFVRTSDISNWEVKIDPKQGLSEEIYQKYAAKQDVREGDILMVKDGTYLIGTCAFVTKYDVRMVYQSHLYKLRVTDPKQISPYLLLAALTSAPVQRQIKSKRFTQDIIDSLGKRILELVLPIPKDELRKKRIIDMVKKALEERIEARELARQACLELVEGFDNANNYLTSKSS